MIGNANGVYMSANTSPATRDLLPYAIMLGTALCFSTNIIFGRFVAPDSHPFVLAFLRWASVALILLPTVLAGQVHSTMAFIKNNVGLLIILGILGMGVSGGGVYWGLQMTTATNATLIYSVAPALILMLERFFRGRPISWREVLGAMIAFAGVAAIITQGSLSTLRALEFNLGDILIAAATLSWASYSILLKTDRIKDIRPMALFCVIAFFGALANLPFAATSLVVGEGSPPSMAGWFALAGIIVISSLMAFSGYQFGIRKLGPSLAGMFMFLMTPFGVILAVIFLGEKLAAYQIVAIGAVMAGVATATMPKSLRSTA